MPRARWIKPEFFTDKKIGELTPMTALVYQALWCWADDGGTAQVDPDMIKSQAFFRWPVFTVQVISTAVRELSDAKMITVYRVGDDYFGSIRHWKRHQSVHKPGKFRYPSPDEQLTLNSAGDRPDTPWNVRGIDPASPPPRVLESQTPRILESKMGSDALPPDSANIVVDTNKRPQRFFDVSDRLESDLDRDALTALADAVPEPASWMAEARASLDGMHGPPLSPKQLGEALREYVGNGNLRSPNFKHFRRYLENAGKTPETANGPRRAVESGNGRSPDTGEAMTILARIKSLREVSTPQAGGQVERIRLSAVEEMGADVVSAFKSVGGADAILKSDPSRWGFLVRDFAVALNYARANPGGSMDG